MAQTRIAGLILVVLCAYVLFFQGLGGAGLIGPDEPRYADIGRAMYESGDWVTPRLFGDAWFEKPALLYWLIGAGFALGLDDTLAPRLPIAILSLAALVAYFFALRRLLGARPALSAALILAVSVGWLGFSHAAVTDLPLTVFFSAGMLFAMPWALKGERNLLPWAAACFALASLAKGLVPLVLAAPLLALGWRRALDWLRPAPLAAFVAVSTPWYALCYARNGSAFVDEFFWKHHVSRFFSPELQHVQPFWFYLPVLFGLLVPVAPLAVHLFRRGLWADPRARYFAAWAAFGFLFFSASTNKLPGYLLPLLPACAALLGLALDRVPRAGVSLGAAALLSAVYALAGGVLPGALAEGIRRAEFAAIPWTWLLPSLAGALAIVLLERSSRRTASLLALLALIALNVGILKSTAFRQLGEQASSRSLWLRLKPHAEAVCIGNSHRSIEYGLRYYSHGAIPLCANSPRPLQIDLRFPSDPLEIPATLQPEASSHE
ncbi:MAG: glycosyltransferase family 39 protein [Bryobacterales bacterium]|nr:glycosyltransferase family 39 protein [Bryobacterales bacterium]